MKIYALIALFLAGIVAAAHAARTSNMQVQFAGLAAACVNNCDDCKGACQLTCMSQGTDCFRSRCSGGRCLCTCNPASCMPLCS